MQDRPRLAAQICDTGRLLHERGLIAATEGNLSLRLGHEILCTPTGCRLENLKPGDLCVVSLGGKQREGSLSATSELPAHLHLYNANPKIGAIVHCHPPHATAFAISGAPLPEALLAEVEFFLGEIPTVQYNTPGSEALAVAVARFAYTHRCAILKNHGAITWSDDMASARSWMEILDAYCRVVLLASRLGPFSPISPSDLQHIRGGYSRK